MLSVQVCQVQSVPGASEVLVYAAGCIQHPTQLHVQSKINYFKKKKALVSMIRPQRAYAAACKAAEKGRRAVARPPRSGTAGAHPAEVRDDAAAGREMAW